MIGKILITPVLLLVLQIFGALAAAGPEIGRKVGQEENENVVDNSLMAWEAPYEIRKLFPYYIAGFDSENRPIMVVEFGKWNIRKIVERGGQNLKDFDKYMDQALYRFVDVQNLKRSDDYPVDGTVIIIDMEGYNLAQMSSVPAVRYTMTMAQKFQKVEHHLAYGMIINTNFVSESLINLIRPILGSTFERIEVWGTNKAHWKPHMLQKLPKSQLPKWYGGGKNFTPVAVYG